MTAFKSLTRVHTWVLDEKRQRLAGIEELVDKMKGDLANLEAELESENRAASASIEGTVAFPAFIAANLERRRRLRQTIAELEESVEAAREEVRGAFAEMKKYERMRDLEDQQKHDERAKRDQAALDEVGTARYQRDHALGEE